MKKIISSAVLAIAAAPSFGAAYFATAFVPSSLLLSKQKASSQASSSPAFYRRATPSMAAWMSTTTTADAEQQQQEGKVSQETLEFTVCRCVVSARVMSARVVCVAVHHSCTDMFTYLQN
jgi:hypothetical protein